MIKTLLTAVAVSFAASAALAEVVPAVLVLDDSECSSGNMVFYSDLGFITAEWFGGLYWEDQVYFGVFNNFGMTSVFDQSGAEIGQVWIDDFMVSQSAATEFCYE
jgi:hypothetical protein